MIKQHINFSTDKLNFHVSHSQSKAKSLQKKVSLSNSKTKLYLANIKGNLINFIQIE